MCIGIYEPLTQRSACLQSHFLAVKTGQPRDIVLQNYNKISKKECFNKTFSLLFFYNSVNSSIFVKKIINFNPLKINMNMDIKKSIVLSLIIIFSGYTFAQSKKINLKNNADSISYLIGADISHNLKNNSINVIPDILFKGFLDAIEGKDTLVINKAKKDELLARWQMEMMKKQQAESSKKAEENKKAGEKFLELNKNVSGVKVLPSGLQYKVLKEGSGPHPKATDKVKVHYHGTLIDGTVFDSSVERGQPISFGLNQVIKGWTEGLQLMQPGAKYIFYIPSDLAYGDREMGKIPAGSTLIFEVELFEIESGE